MVGGKTRLSAGDLLLCAKEPWETAFNMQHCLSAWEKIGVSPFSRSVYWDLKKQGRGEVRGGVTASAEINPELLTLEGMVKIIFPNAASQTVRMLPAQGGAQQAGQKRPGEHNLHSTDLWDLPGGATGDECFEIVKAKTLAKRAKESEAMANKKQREAKRKDKHASAN